MNEMALIWVGVGCFVVPLLFAGLYLWRIVTERN